MPFVKGARIIIGDDVARFWSKTTKSGQCVTWTGSRDKHGYGKFMVGRHGKQKTWRPHRWIYERSLSKLNGAFLLHSCDNPACVSLQHLSPGSQSQNIKECVSRGRHHSKRTISSRHAAEIRWLALNGGNTLSDIASCYGVSQEMVAAIKYNLNYKELDPVEPK